MAHGEGIEQRGPIKSEARNSKYETNQKFQFSNDKKGISMTAAWIVLPAVILLIGLLYFETREKTAGMLAFKTPLSSLFIVTAIVQPHPEMRYFQLMLAGFVFCMGGDVLLALPQKKAFMAGLVSFLIGHLFYVAAFFKLSSSHALLWVGAAIVVPAGIVVFTWLKPHLGSMKIPVLLYIVIISLMLVGAITIFGDDHLGKSFHILVMAGAFCFYCSDIFVARHRFVRKEIINRYIGLSLYYTGQFLLAFSVGFS